MNDEQKVDVRKVCRFFWTSMFVVILTIGLGIGALGYGIVEITPLKRLMETSEKADINAQQIERIKRHVGIEDKK